MGIITIIGGEGVSFNLNLQKYVISERQSKFFKTPFLYISFTRIDPNNLVH